ncbi:hypothetical protein DPMN_123107 [Dreissena polymorpha]|uniref:DNA repair protein Rev1 C-terminal domain-containing protein n=3 Tax=Dreissena polymorpha TaxID=45954 RepID=A0A9D4JSK9_DREPO|nr:hypothetical protein DPMN_123107 [Dreissena polymorpha]
MTVITGTDIGDAEATRASTSSTSGPMDSVETITDVSRDSASVGVNLCGAVSIHNVRILLREWISSTPAPQAEDEEVLISYLQDLVMDKNLEQVDLVLKFMARNLKQQENDNWLTSLHRIFTQTQALVFHLYGSRLASISV